MKTIELIDRNCDCCGSGQLEEVWRYTKESKTKHHMFIWQVRDVICRECGFSFVSPSPGEASLRDYYEDSYEYFHGIELDYSIENRIHLIVKHLQGNPRARYVEVGGNENTRFMKELSNYVGSVASVELNASCKSDYSSLDALGKESADIIAAYFVLEHMPNPKRFFELCAGCLRQEGILIVEVPNLHIYPINPAGLLLWEHTNHFSPRSLSYLAALRGFRLLEVSHEYCSRPFGFTAVFSKTAKITIPNLGRTEYDIARRCMYEGVERIKEYRSRLIKIRARIDSTVKDGGSVVIWAANAACLALLEGYDLPGTAIIVDSNPEKKNYLTLLKVYQPKEAFEYIRNAGLLVINTKLHAQEILRFIKDNIGREFSKDELIIVE